MTDTPDTAKALTSELRALIRYRIGRALIHLGLRIMPPGRPRSELFALFDQWATKVRETLDAARSALGEKREGLGGLGLWQRDAAPV